jgi:hypothetical protein
MITIVGAGMAGLLAANMFRKDDRVAVIEAAPSLPNNHSAVLRFRSMVVSDVLGIEFKKVSVMRAIHPWKNPLADALAYSFKSNGVGSLRSIAHADGSMVDRYIAPPDLIARMAGGVAIGYDIPLTAEMVREGRLEGHHIISTIPMPAAMDLLEWNGFRPEFRYQHGTNIVVKLNDVEAWGSLYVPAPSFLGARLSLMGNTMIIECPTLDSEAMRLRDEAAGAAEDAVAEACAMMGIPPGKVAHYHIRAQRYAKIMEVPDAIRKTFIMWASEVHNFHSLGRFATWRPGLLLDDVVHDVRVIQRIIRASPAPRYEARKT